MDQVMRTRVRELDLQITVPASQRSRAAEFRRLVETDLAPRVLRALGETLRGRLEGAFPHAVIRMHSISVHWPVAQEWFESGRDDDRVDRLGCQLADDLAAGILDQLTRQPEVIPDGEAAVVAFRDRAHARAVALSVSDNRPWFVGADTPDDVWTATCRDGPRAVRAVLDWLDRLGTVASALGRLPTAALDRATQQLPVAEWPASARVALAGRTDATASARSTGTTASPELPQRPEVLGLAEGRVALAGRTDATASPELPVRPEVLGLAEGRAAALRPAAPERPASIASAARAAAAPDSRGSNAERSTERISFATDTEAVPAASPLASERSTGVIPTDFAGLFYLVRCMLELDIGESLWCAGVPEGHVLCHVARLLAVTGTGENTARAARDPAPRLLGGIFDRTEDPPLAPIPDWALAEVADKSVRSVGVALVRRGLPEQQPERLTATIEQLALTLRGDQAPDALSGQKSGPGDARALVHHLAAALLYFMVARLDVADALDSGVQALCARIFAIRGTIAVGRDAMYVTMPFAAIDIDIRRAGLDFNPGHAPWLARDVRIEFIET